MRCIREHPLLERYRGDAAFRARASLAASLAMNSLYAVVKAVFGAVYHSQWMGLLAAYYLLVSLIRYALLRTAVKAPDGHPMLGEWRRYRLCGIALLLLNQVVAAVVFLMVRRGDGFRYPGFIVYAAALYAFYTVIMAVIHMMRFRAKESPVLAAAKAVNLATAMVSILALETAMIDRFGTPEQAVFRTVTVSLSGMAVVAGLLAMGIVMIRRANEAIRTLKQKEHLK